MGTYYRVINHDKKVWLDPRGVLENETPDGWGNKFGPTVGSEFAHLLAVLMVFPWSGDHVTISGDYDNIYERVESEGWKAYEVPPDILELAKEQCETAHCGVDGSPGGKIRVAVRFRDKAANFILHFMAEAKKTGTKTMFIDSLKDLAAAIRSLP